MRKIDKIYINCPFYSTDALGPHLRIRAIWSTLSVFHLMKQMGLMAIFPKPNLAKANKQYKIFPYWLQARVIDKVNEILSIDISYIRAAWLSLPGPYHQPLCVELALIKHWDTSFCLEALDESFKKYEHPEIFNSD